VRGVVRAVVTVVLTVVGRTRFHARTVRPAPASSRTSRRLLGWLLIVAVSSGCAAWHDLFQRDRPDGSTLTTALKLPAPQSTDVGIALGCPSEDDGSPSDCLRCRVAGALRALRQKRVQAVIFSGGAAHNRHVEAEVMAALTRAQGVPDGQILVEGQALTTWQNLRNAQRLMRSRGYKTALLISTRDHLPRARRFADYYGIPSALMACEED
jgi:uncharacterized SAM-binding protein YcdF (DUF218 family)